MLLDVPGAELAQAETLLPERLADAGLVLTPCVERLATFAAVENTYLAIFLGLGGLALLLGSAGLWALVARNVEERRGELALLRAVGFSRRQVVMAVSGEHAGLLLAGLGAGGLAGLVAVLPSLLAPGGNADLSSVGLWVGLILASGLAWIALAAVMATRGELAQALRDE
jgi:ABC-type antimicrobial peptide transport system permease subunit